MYYCHNRATKYKKTSILTGLDPSKDTLALEKDKFPAKNEPPL